MAGTSLGSLTTLPHSEKGRFEATATKCPLFAFSEDLEEQLGPADVELEIAELIEDIEGTRPDD
jgi:hypothetical protein